MIPTFTTLGSGHTVLMLHGIGGGHLAFAPQVETLASQGYRAVAWDMPGYGYSPPIEPYTFKGLAQSCITLIETLVAGERGGEDERRRVAPRRESPLGGQRSTRSDERGGIILLGHSMGAMVAQEVVVRRPDLVNRLILCGTSPSFGKPDGGWQRDFVASRTAPLGAGQSMEQLAQVLVPQMIGPGALPEGVRLAEYCMAQVHPATYRRALECLVTFDRRAALALISVPTLLVAGELPAAATPRCPVSATCRIWKRPKNLMRWCWTFWPRPTPTTSRPLATLPTVTRTNPPCTECQCRRAPSFDNKERRGDSR